MYSPQTVKIADQLFEIAERLDAERVRPARGASPPGAQPVHGEELTVPSSGHERARPRRGRPADRIRPHPSERAWETL
jgi:hypothetical protein